MIPKSSIDAYNKLVSQLDAYARHVLLKYGSEISCRSGCSRCCILKTTNLIESEILCNAVRELPAPKKKLLRNRLAKPNSRECCLLIGGKCVVYDKRPVICRTHGYPLNADGRMIYCNLNFRNGIKVNVGSVIELSKIDIALAAIDIAYQQSLVNHKVNGKRIRIKTMLRKAFQDG